MGKRKDMGDLCLAGCGKLTMSLSGKCKECKSVVCIECGKKVSKTKYINRCFACGKLNELRIRHLDSGAVW